MAPTPQEYAVPDDVVAGLQGERVVISGMSGLYPQSNHVQDLSDILYNKVNPVTDENSRWDYKHPEVSNHTGKVPELQKFDAQFFKIHYRLGNNMDSMSRKMLEHAYQAIYDAGVSPEQLSGKKVGVYTGSCFSETEKVCFYVASSRAGFGIAGCSKTMFANRISYWLNAKGPSMSIDESCCSSIAALEQAYQSIVRGECEAAIVGGANLCLHPQSSVHYSRIMTFCADGKTKSFDQNADGCAKSEAINVLFLQKAKVAKRIYAEILHIKNIFTSILEGETSPKYGFYRDPKSMAEFMKQFYKEAKVSPHAVEYVEAFGSAVPEADKAELEAIEEVYCKDRSDTLLVGSVMSNIGYGEAASGISAITKVLLGYHKGKLAANLHCENPRQDIASLRDGRMRIVTEHQTFGRTYTAVNGISVTGVNAHVLLHGNYKPKDANRYKTSIPHLVTLSGRQDSAVKRILEDLKTRDIDPEELALLHNIHKTRISGHLGRGYVVLAKNEEQKTVSLAEQASYFDDAKRPLWFVYSGMGSQWAGMGTQLMRLPIFAAAIKKCHKVLEPKGVDIIHIITSPDKTIFDNILHSFVGIAAIQIGLTDILSALGLVPDMIIGHSVGELGCAYADGCFTAEEMILSAYSRGLVSVQTPFIRGSMAAVGIGYQQMVNLLPPEIEVACHNGPESCTISGPADAMREFVTKLTAQSIFAKEVPCSNIAYHSRYIAEAGPGLRKYLSKVIKNPKPRSERWVSSSVPEERWNEPIAKLSSAEYHTNNLLNPVLFEEACRHIPENAVLVEIAPHGLMQAILKRSLPAACHHVPLTRRGHPDNTFLLLDAIGKLYMDGYYPNVELLYPKVEFPVSTGTPMLSHLVEWAHDEDWSVPLYVSARQKMAASCKFKVSIHDEEHSYLQGNMIRGKTVYPFSAALVAAWDTLAMTFGMVKKQMSVEFRDVHLFAQPPLHEQRNLILSVSLHRGTGYFEIMDENRKVATGYIIGISEPKNNSLKKESLITSSEGKIDWEFNSEDIYQLMYERDYFYSGDFRSIYKANSSLTRAQIIWNDNWVTFIDGILQLTALRQTHDTVSQPSQIRLLYIDVDEHLKEINVNVIGNKVLAAAVSNSRNIVRCGGVLMKQIIFHGLPSLNKQTIAMQTLKFVPRSQSDTDTNTALHIYLQMVAENMNKESLNILKIVAKNSVEFDKINMSLVDIPGITFQFEQMQSEKVLEMRDYFLRHVDITLVQNLTADKSLCRTLYRVLQRDSFLVNLESTDDQNEPSALYHVVSSYKDTHTKLELVRWRPTPISAAPLVVNVRVRSDIALLTTKRDSLSQKQNMVILSSYPPVSGLTDLVKEWRRESDRNQIYLVVSDKHNIDKIPELDLAFNVVVDGIWGGEYYLPLRERVTVERSVALRIGQIGDLESLQWIEATEPVGPGITVTVHYAAVNNRDVKRATGIISVKDDTEADTTFGMDFSGTTDRGERVMGIVYSGAASGRVKARPELLWPVPAHWSLEDAATVPSAYAHAFYCYAIKADLRLMMTVLIHGGSGALGQAAIAIGLAHGCKIFTTVSNQRKKRFLMRLFPELREDHIGYSRDSSFRDMVLNETDGKGCNIVICCLKGELKNVFALDVSTKIFGVVLDTVQLSQREQYSFGMHNLVEARHYTPIDFPSIFVNENLKEMKMLQMLISEGISHGYVRPLSRVTYAPHEVSRAFRLVSASRHRGRAIIRLREPVEVIQSRVFCSPDLCHLLICDGDIIGLKLADRLITRGARKLHLHCGNISTHLQIKIKSWEKLGVKVEVSSEDLTNTDNVLRLMNNCNRLGPVEGLYIVATSSPTKVVIASHLDLVLRNNLYPSLRYFAVVCDGTNIIGEEMCLSRVRNGLPGTMISLGLNKVGEANNSRDVLSWRSAVDVIERAIYSSQAGILAYPKKQSAPSLLQQILAIAEIKILDEITQSFTLLDLGMELAKVPAICSFLQDYHNVSLPEEQIPELTVQQIRDLDEVISGTKHKEVRGLETFFSYVDPDELLATNEIVFMSTLTVNSVNVGDDEIDTSQTYLCVVPGLEGHHGRFRELCEKLKLPAIVLQPGFDHRQETPRQTAERHIKILLKYSSTKKFYLVGYESGVIVALEMAAILENIGLVGTVFCIGGTPEEVKSSIERQLCDLDSDEALQDAVVRHMFSLMVKNTEGLEEALQYASTWQEKVEACVRMLLGRVAHSAQYARTLIDAAYMRIKQTLLYKVETHQLRSRIIFLQPRSSPERSSTKSMKILQKHSQQSVIVYELHLPLAHATKDLRCPAIINKYLDEDILAAFEQKNLCDSYLMNRYTLTMRRDDDICVV